MTARVCKFGCQTVLDGWDDNAKKYIEAGSGGLHTRERCEEAKAKLAQQEQKNDHGDEFIANEISRPVITPPVQEFVDHTAPSAAQGTKGYFMAFSAPTTEELNHLANGWLYEHSNNVRFKQWGQLQTTKDGFAIALYYEEIKQ
jgi:hypothetical protein